VAEAMTAMLMMVALLCWLGMAATVSQMQGEAALWVDFCIRVQMKITNGFQGMVSRGGVVAAALVLSGMLSGCVVVGASSSGGWFIWPGGFGLIFMIVLLVILLRRRR